MSRRITTRALVAHHLRSRSGGGAHRRRARAGAALLATAAPIALGVLGRCRPAGPARTRSAPSTATSRPTHRRPAPGRTGRMPTCPPTTRRRVGRVHSRPLERLRTSADARCSRSSSAPRAASRSSPTTRSLEDPRTLALSLAFDPASTSSLDASSRDGCRIRPRVVAGRAGGDAGARMEVVLSTISAEQMDWSVGEIAHDRHREPSRPRSCSRARSMPPMTKTTTGSTCRRCCSRTSSTTATGRAS